jgi:endogenous inhibitor of DNA gyrase (YacG/DUF329 family)
MSARCPICGAETQPRYRPFCSRRCADEDLMRWLKGSYVIAASDDDDAAPEMGDGQGRDHSL